MVGTDTSGPGEAVSAIRWWKFKGVKPKNWKLKILKIHVFWKNINQRWLPRINTNVECLANFYSRHSWIHWSFCFCFVLRRKHLLNNCFIFQKTFFERDIYDFSLYSLGFPSSDSGSSFSRSRSIGSNPGFMEIWPKRVK